MLTDVEGIRVGHWTDQVGMTGCTVVLCADGTVGSCENRGGSPGDREWVLLQPENRVDRVNAVVLSGGSAFGLATADGVMRWLDERGIGWPAGGGKFNVPIVPAAILFDLGQGDPSARPGARQGEAACDAATDGQFQTGRVGAGTGCTVGKLHGIEYATRSGIGTWTISSADGLKVSALIAVNAVGDVLDEQGQLLAGSTAPKGTPVMPLPVMQSTVIGVVATNAILTKNDAFLLAKAGQDGISTVVHPAHTRYDGDVIFGLGTCRMQTSVDQVLALAPGAVAGAIRQAVRAASA
ncbi:MAG: P1 family peptidase [Actinomycetota bacterium]|nr:P1 family peptidase [Actinomycetota bacterium]